MALSGRCAVGSALLYPPRVLLDFPPLPRLPRVKVALFLGIIAALTTDVKTNECREKQSPNKEVDQNLPFFIGAPSHTATFGLDSLQLPSSSLLAILR